MTKNYQILGLLPDLEQNVVKIFAADVKMTTAIIKDKLKYSHYDMWYVLDRLKKKGLIAVESNPLNKRTKIYSLTPKGVKIKGLL